jgi:hypothetical protein
MQVGDLDMLCVIPHNEIEKYGIPFLWLVLEKDADDEMLEKLVIFWHYFEKQWLRIRNSLNIIDKNGKPAKMINHTNNTVESYNHGLNNLFPAKPSSHFCSGS